MSDTSKKFYLTTPIYYVNARPHIGHAYTTIVADVLARRHRLLGEDTFFLTGTDEHGQKIERSAAAAGVPPQQFADQVSASFENLWKRMGITHDAYIRTTDPRHKRGVQKLFADLYDRGFITLASYTGQYSIGEEMFVEGPPGTIGPDGKPTETVTEENFFFKLSAFQRPLIDLIESGTLAVEPEARRNEVLSFLRGNVAAVVTDIYDQGAGKAIGSSQPYRFQIARREGRLEKAASDSYYVPGALKDLSVSRSSFTWGIPVPEPAASDAKEKHVIYVWLDALANYMTAIGYGSEDPADLTHFEKYWPADLHLVGKEIIRFHCVYWPAFLLALNPALQQDRSRSGQDRSLPQQDRSSSGLQSAVNTSSESGASALGLSPDPATMPLEVHKLWAAKMLPKAVTAHGWLLFDNSKMSKSKGNIVRTETILDAFGDRVYGAQFPDSPKAERDLFAADVLRYFLLREIPFGQDGSFSFEALITRYNADLANGYGNLVSRTLSMIEKYCSGFVPVIESIRLADLYDRSLIAGHLVYLLGARSQLEDLSALLKERPFSLRSNDPERTKEIGSVVAYTLQSGQFDIALEHASRFVSGVDTHITATAPWTLAKSKERRDQLEGVLYVAAESIRIITALLYPILPATTAKVWLQLGLGDIELAARNGDLKNLQWGGLKPGTKLGPLAPIFPRADKGLAQIMTDMENPDTPTPNASLIDQNSTRPDSPLKTADTPTPARPVTDDSTHPGAAPRTSALEDPTASTHVGGSAAITTERVPSPPHTEAPASGIFAASPPSPATTELPDQISIDDFIKIELRVAQIVVAERIPKADKLLRLEVDLGPDFPRRQILSGIAEWYTPEDLIGRRIVVITNLAPRKMRGLESHGMLLAASHGENGKPVLATFAEDIALGSRLK